MIKFVTDTQILFSMSGEQRAYGRLPGRERLVGLYLVVRTAFCIDRRLCGLRFFTSKRLLLLFYVRCDGIEVDGFAD